MKHLRYSIKLQSIIRNKDSRIFIIIIRDFYMSDKFVTRELGLT